MKLFRHFLIITLLAGAVGGYFWVQMQEEAKASAPVVPIADATPAKEIVVAAKEDPRLAGLKVRADGARLLWAANGEQTPLRAAFVDNGTLVVSATSGNAYGLYALELSTQKIARKLEGATPRIASNHRPSNKNAERFCYSEQAEHGAMEIFCRTQVWEKPVRITTHDGQEDLLEPAISPEGGHVIFEVNADRMAAKTRVKAGRPEPGTSSIWIIGLNERGLRQLTRGADDRAPTWSEDGSKIYFQRRAPDGNWDLYVMFADGAETMPILRTPDEDERWPVRVGSSRKIVAIVAKRGEPGRVKLIDTQTKSGRWLTDAELGPATDLSISPDGKLVSFLAPLDPADPTRLGVWLKGIE